jgi:hypothetical protein
LRIIKQIKIRHACEGGHPVAKKLFGFPSTVNFLTRRGRSKPEVNPQILNRWTLLALRSPKGEEGNL